MKDFMKAAAINAGSAAGFVVGLAGSLYVVGKVIEWNEKKNEKKVSVDEPEKED